MKNRILLAFFVSFVFISTWNLIFKQADVAVEPAFIPEETMPIAAPQAPVVLEVEKNYFLENHHVRVDLTNLGGAIKGIFLKEYEVTLPTTNFLQDHPETLGSFSVEQKSDSELIFINKTSDFRRKKRIVFSGDYSLLIQLEISNLSNEDKKTKISTEGFTLDINRVDKNGDFERDRGLFEYTVSSKGGIVRKDNAFSFNVKKDNLIIDKTDWVGFRNKYYCAILKPNFDNSTTEARVLSDNTLLFTNTLDDITIPAGGNKLYEYTLYFGPQKMELLKTANKGFEKIWVFSRYGFLDFIAKSISQLLAFFHKFIPNLGVCVILTSFAIYLLLYPLTIQSSTSMRKMQLLQPKINEIREKFKDNPQRMNKDVMELYKENKVNPFSGCLPLFLQMPIFIALYQVLWRSVSLKGSSFLWIKDLSEPDRLIIFPKAFPFIGNEFNILPIIIALLLFLQQKITMKNIVNTDPAQIMQQKMMLFFMPIFLGFVFYKFPGGLSIYFTVFYLLSTLTQWKMSKTISS